MRHVSVGMLDLLDLGIVVKYLLMSFFFLPLIGKSLSGAVLLCAFLFIWSLFLADQ